MFAFFAQPPECLLAVDRINAATLQIVISAIERFLQRDPLFQVRGEGILYKFIRRSSGRGGEIVELFRQIGTDVDFHALTVRLPRG